MSDAQATSPEREVAPPAALAETPQDQPRDDNEADEASQVEAEHPEGAEAVEDEVEIDIGGSKHKLKKGAPVGEALDLVQKYQKGLETSLQQKSQEVAAKGKTVDEQVKLVTRLQTLKGDQLALYARGTVVGEEIGSLEKIDLNALWRSSPDQARQVSDRLGQLRHEYSQIYGSLAQYGEHLNREERALLDSRAVEGEQIVRKAIKGFSPQVESEMIDYAVKRGVSEQDAKMWRLNPYAAETTWKAMQYDKLLAQGKAAAKPAATPAPEKPVAPIKGGRGGNSGPADLESMSMSDYAEYRRKQDRRSR